MNFKKIDTIKGFMPLHEGKALMKWAKKFSKLGPILEIGSYCGKSAIFLSHGAFINEQLVYTIDHHKGSEEHQINEEYFDKSTYDFEKESVNTLPFLIKNINAFKAHNIVPIIGKSIQISKNWNEQLGMVFIDGGHSYDSANSDYLNWNSKIISKGSLVIHDIFENPNDGGQAPYEIYQKALRENFKVFDKVDTCVCLIKN